MKNIRTYLRGARQEYCEDTLFACSEYAFVLDGATGVSGQRVSDAATDAVWFVARIREYLSKALAENRPIGEIVAGGARSVRALFDQFDGAEQLRDKPSAAVSIVRERNGMLEYFSLCDSVILLRKKNGDVQYIMDDRLVALDNAMFERMKKIAAETGKTVRDTFKDVFPYILENRYKMNTPGWYAALSCTEEGLDTALRGSIPVSELRDVLLFSDGFAEAYDLFGIYKTPAEIIEEVSVRGIDYAVERLRRAQDADPDCARYVRNKLRDDMSIIYAGF